jgi:hypothetical protein
MIENSFHTTNSEKKLLPYIALLLILFSLGNYALNGFFAGLRYKGGDFLNYYVIGKALIEGVNIHDDAEREAYAGKLGALLETGQVKRYHQADYPPFWYLLMSALTVLPWHWAFYLWTLINQFLLALTVYFLFRYYNMRLYSLEGALAFFLIFNFFPLFYNQLEGQVNILLLLMFVWSMWLFKNNRDWGAGLLLGLATGIKIIPGFLLLFYLWKRQFKVVLFGFIGFLLTLAFTAWRVGLEVIISYFTVQVPKYGGEPRPDACNQSLNAFFARLLDNPLIVKYSTLFFSLAILALILYVTRKKSGRCDFHWELDWGIFLISMMILSAWTMGHHFINLYIPILTLFLGYSRGNRFSPLSIVLALFCYTILSLGLPISSPRFNYGILVLVKSLDFYALVMLDAIFIYTRYRE